MAIEISIVSGFLGVGKTTFLKKILPVLKGKTVLIENEFGDVAIDSSLLPEELPIRELNAGCICCSVARDFERAIEEMAETYHPDRILIEPSGVAGLSEIMRVCQKMAGQGRFDLSMKHLITLVDICTFDDYQENFGLFYLDQIENGRILFLSFWEDLLPEERGGVIARIRAANPEAVIWEEDWLSAEGEKLAEILDGLEDLSTAQRGRPALTPAQKIFSTFSVTKPRTFDEAELEPLLTGLADREKGFILRAKGILHLRNGRFIHFDYTPSHHNWAYLEGPQEPKVAVIGSALARDQILSLF